jgi:hypothetical protein
MVIGEDIRTMKVIFIFSEEYFSISITELTTTVSYCTNTVRKIRVMTTKTNKRKFNFHIPI